MDEKNLVDQLKVLEVTLKKINSFKSVFARGVVNGVGTFIGATIVAALVITIMVQVLKFLDLDLGIGEYLQSLLPWKR
jgi:hypothetical protein